MIVVNFDVLIGTEGTSPLSWILPAVALVPGVLGVLWGLYLKSARPQVYSGIGSGGNGDD
jgi:hypothetical protein